MTAAPGSFRSAHTEIVYVVDDDEAVRDSLRWLLEGQGFRVTAFESAERFLASLPAGATGPLPGCLIADVRMPDMPGHRPPAHFHYRPRIRAHGREQHEERGGGFP